MAVGDGKPLDAGVAKTTGTEAVVGLGGKIKMGEKSEDSSAAEQGRTCSMPERGEGKQRPLGGEGGVDRAGYRGVSIEAGEEALGKRLMRSSIRAGQPGLGRSTRSRRRCLMRP